MLAVLHALGVDDLVSFGDSDGGFDLNADVQSDRVAR